MNKEEQFQKDRIVCRRDHYNGAKKNMGGSAFNIISLNYDNNSSGNMLKQIDNDAQVRALMRSKVLDRKNNGQYNILTGTSRPPIAVPHHERYNPPSRGAIGSAANQIISSSRRSNAASGIVPGLN